MNQDHIKNRIFESIHVTDPNAEAYLFGSRARGDAGPESDWDVLILVDEKKVTNEIEDKFRDKLYNIELETGQIISIFIYPKDYWSRILAHTPLFKKVKKEGIRL